MMNTHPGDMAVQAYVLQENSNEEVAAHIQQCPQCLALVQQYRQLFAEIKEEEEPVFDFNLTQLVMAQLPQPAATKKESAAAKIAAWLFAAAAFALLFYFAKPMLQSLFNSIASMMLYLIATAAVCISVVLVIDLFKKHQQKMNAINKYA